MNKISDNDHNIGLIYDFFLIKIIVLTNLKRYNLP